MEEAMLDKNGLQIRPLPDGRYDLEYFPLGTTTTRLETGLTAHEVAQRLYSAPAATEVQAFSEGRPIDIPEEIRVQLNSLGKRLFPASGCPSCKGTGLQGEQACPDCGVPWAGPNG